MDDTPLDRIRQKRQSQALEQTESAKTQSIIDAIKTSGGETKDGVTSAVHDLIMATLVAKDPRMTEVAKSLTELIDNIREASAKVQSVDMSPLSDKFGALDKTLRTLPDRMGQVNAEYDSREEIKKLNQLIASKNFSPNISVSAPKVNIDPLKEILQQSSNELDLSSYRAQDIDEEEMGVQYIGFVNPKGAWYIIRNDEEKNALRYKFGRSRYSAAWGKLSTFDYKLLDEAYDEVRS